MTTIPDTLALIGNTPLVRLKGPSEETAGAEIFGKCEFANPGGSVKDRAALFIVARCRGARAARSRAAPSSRAQPAIPASAWRWSAMRQRLSRRSSSCPRPRAARRWTRCARSAPSCVLVAPTAAYSNPGHFVHTSRRIAEETEGAIWANQFDNIANRRAHIVGTAEEIWAQMDGRIDGFTCAAGTGGTIAGVGMGLKEFRDDIVCIALTESHGAALYNYYAHGELKRRGQIRHRRGDRPGPHHRQSRRRADRRAVPHLRRGGAGAWVRRLLERGRALPRPVVGHPRRRRDSAGAAARPAARRSSRPSCAIRACAISRRCYNRA